MFDEDRAGAGGHTKGQVDIIYGIIDNKSPGEQTFEHLKSAEVELK